MTDRVLGVLGGMGPLASAQFMVRLTLLTPAERDQEHIPAVLWSDPRVPDRGEAMRPGGTDPLPWLLRGIDGLKRAGCGAIVIPCNTAHAWYDQISRHAEVPMPHIVDAAAADLARIGIRPSRIGLMGTATTLRTKLYQQRLAGLGWDCLEPTETQMARLVSPAIARVKANQVADAIRTSGRGGGAISPPAGSDGGRAGMHGDPIGHSGGSHRRFERCLRHRHHRRSRPRRHRLGRVLRSLQDRLACSFE